MNKISRENIRQPGCCMSTQDLNIWTHSETHVKKEKKKNTADFL